MFRLCLILLSVFCIACSSYTGEKTFIGSHDDPVYGTYTTILEFENNETEVTFSAAQFAEAAMYVLQAWEESDAVNTPDRMYQCLNNTYIVIADRKTINDICGREPIACSWSSRNLRWSKRINSPTRDAIFILDEEYLAHSYITFAHEFLHGMMRCLNDNQRAGDSDHSTAGVWQKVTLEGNGIEYAAAIKMYEAFECQTPVTQR